MSDEQAEQTPASQSTSAPSGETTSEERTMGMLCHLLVIFTGFLGPLIIWLIKKDQSAFINSQGKEALNWIITIAIAMVGVVILALIPFVNLVVCFLYPAVLVVVIVFGIIGAMQANKGIRYRYPFAIRLIK